MSNYTILPQKGFCNEGTATLYMNTSVELHTNVASCNTFCLSGAYGQTPKCEWCSVRVRVRVTLTLTEEDNEEEEEEEEEEAK